MQQSVIRGHKMFIEYLELAEIPFLKIGKKGVHILLANKTHHYLIIYFGTFPLAFQAKGFNVISITAYSFIGAIKSLEKYKKNKL
jgi:hypothetical protein